MSGPLARGPQRSAHGHALLRKLDEAIYAPWCATVAKLAEYGIRENDIFGKVGTGMFGPIRDHALLAPLLEVAPLPELEEMLAARRRDFLRAESAPRLGAEAKRIALDVGRLEKKVRKLRALANTLKLGKGRKWDVPPPEFWRMSPAEIRERRWTYAKLERSEHVGDAIVKLYDFLAGRIPSQRRQGLGAREVTFNARAAELTAEVATNLWGFVSRPLTARDVKNRLLKRGRRALA